MLRKNGSGCVGRLNIGHGWGRVQIFGTCGATAEGVAGLCLYFWCRELSSVCTKVDLF